jgi:hypothetical protein
MRGALWLVCVLAPFIATTTQAQEWVQTVVYDPVDGYLGDRQSEPGRYENFEYYDDRTYRFSSIFDLEMDAPRAFVVEVYSNEFQPALSIQDLGQKVLAYGTFYTPQQAASQGSRFAARLEFHSETPGPAQLIITSHDVGQGAYRVIWSLWKPASAAEQTPASPNPDCTCYDAASGRWFQMPLWDMTDECRPQDAVQWCN